MRFLAQHSAATKAAPNPGAQTGPEAREFTAFYLAVIYFAVFGPKNACQAPNSLKLLK